MDNKKRAGANIAFWLALAAALLISCSLTNVLKTPTKRPQITNQPETIATPTKGPQRCIVMAHFLNLRDCSGTDCAVIEVLEQGHVLTIKERGHWLNVQTETGAAGYINSSYCKETE